jgi:hypothetical protein
MVNKSFVFSLALLFSMPYLFNVSIVNASENKNMPYTKSIETQLQFEATRVEIDGTKREMKVEYEKMVSYKEEIERYAAYIEQKSLKACIEQVKKSITDVTSAEDYKKIDEFSKDLVACKSSREHMEKIFDTIKSYYNQKFVESEIKLQALSKKLSTLQKDFKTAEAKFTAVVAVKENQPVNVTDPAELPSK